MPAVGARGGVDQPGRTFTCAPCQRQVLLCSGCDRGQRYCSVDCRQQARKTCLRQAGRRYQDSRAGRFAHARRARRYRQRQKIVTHQASQAVPAPVTVALDPVQAEVATAAAITAPAWRCWRCGGVCQPLVRRGFLRRDRVPREVAPQGSGGPVHGQSP